jgi:hypothetical protein
MHFDSPILGHMRRVLDDHTLPLDNNHAGVVEAVWLLYMIREIEGAYRQNGLL